MPAPQMEEDARDALYFLRAALTDPSVSIAVQASPCFQNLQSADKPLDSYDALRLAVELTADPSIVRAYHSRLVELGHTPDSAAEQVHNNNNRFYSALKRMVM